MAPGEFATYEEAIAFLTAAIDYEKTVAFKYTDSSFNLQRVERLLEAVGSPHRGLACVHVAGTKGKGSTCHMLEKALRACGMKTGLFTSPHLVHLEERIRINGEKVSRDDMRQRLSELADYVGRARREDMASSPTYFEMLTAVALRQFRLRELDAAVVEVGLGGRLDSTNVVSPLACGVTTLDLDHTDKLGNDIASIAREKAGIIKNGVPVVCSQQRPEALAVIQRKCDELGAELWLSGRDLRVENRADGLFAVSTPAGDYEGLRLCLEGDHQRENCAVALGLLELAAPRLGCSLDRTAVASAIASTTAPGRIQLVARRPATIVDVAHTEGSFRRLLDVLETSFAWDRLCLVLGFSADKNISAMLRAIAEWSQALGGKRKGCEVTACFTRADNPRAAAPEALAEEAGRAGLINVSCEPDPVWAFESCRERSGEGGLVCVAGSFYLAGRIMEHLGVEP